MKWFIVVLMGVVVMTSGCRTLGGGCGHKKYVKCLECRAKSEAEDAAKKAVKCKKCGIVKGACKCKAKAEAKCTKCTDGPCKCKK